MACRTLSNVAGQASRAAFVFCVLSIAAVTEAQVAGSAQVAEAATDEAALVQFYGGGSALTPAQRADLGVAVREAFVTDPRGAQSAAQDAAQVLVILRRQSGANVAFAREMGRRQVAFGGMHALGPGTEGRVAARIIESHDPAVISDSSRGQLVTRQTIEALTAGVVDGAALFGLPQLRVVSQEDLVLRIRTGWRGMDEGIRDAVSHAERDMPFAVPFLAQAPTKARQSFLERWRPQVMKGADPGEQQLRIAEIMAFVGATGFKNRASLGGAVARAYQNQAAIDRAGRALMPGCAAPAGSVMRPEARSFCQPSPVP